MPMRTPPNTTVACTCAWLRHHGLKADEWALQQGGAHAVVHHHQLHAHQKQLGEGVLVVLGGPFLCPSAPPTPNIPIIHLKLEREA